MVKRVLLIALLGLGLGGFGLTMNCSDDDAVCGNDVIETGEECEGTDLNGETCASLSGFSSGDLDCTTTCQFDTTDCSPI